MPLFPSTSARQFSSTPIPSGVTRPMPVMTTLCMLSFWSKVRPTASRTGQAPAPSGYLLLDVGLDVVDGILDGLDLLGILLGDLDVERLLERQNQLHDGERIFFEVVNERRRTGQLLRRDLELRADDVLDLALDLLGIHALPSLIVSVPFVVARRLGPR